MPRYWTDIQRNQTNVIIGEPVIGEGTWIGHFTIIDASGGLTIGKETVISSAVAIYTHESVSRHKKIKAPVRIGNKVILGHGAIILPGCVIEDEAVIGAGSVLTKNTRVGKKETWAGVPAKFIDLKK